jgi:hypothetical protein
MCAHNRWHKGGIVFVVSVCGGKDIVKLGPVEKFVV